jgi:hypothetical protein
VQSAWKSRRIGRPPPLVQSNAFACIHKGYASDFCMQFLQCGGGGVYFIRYIALAELAYTVCVALACRAVVTLASLHVLSQERDAIQDVIRSREAKPI